MTAPAGAVVRIYYDGADVHAGDMLRTPTGRLYSILTRRVQQRGKHVGRQHLVCFVVKEPTAGARVRRLHWYKRNTRRK